MVARNVIPADVKAKLPDISGTFFPTLDQITEATNVITEHWPSVTGVGPLKTDPPATRRRGPQAPQHVTEEAR